MCHRFCRHCQQTAHCVHNAYDVSPKKKREKNNFPNEQADVTMDYRKIISTL